MKNIFIITFLMATNVSLAAVIPVTIGNGNLRPLGTGYDTRKSVLYTTCVDNSFEDESNGPKFDIQNSSGSFSLSLESSQESISKKLGLDVGGRFRSGVTEYSASAEFLKTSKSNSYSISYNYVSEHLFQEAMTPTRSRPVKVLPSLVERVLERDLFFQTCGDEYVWMRDRAARLLININISFVSTSERNRFATKFGISSPVTKFDASFENDMKSFSQNNQMSVKAIQIGGDTTRLGTILCPKKSNGEVDEECDKSGAAVVECSFGKMKDCTMLIANAVRYSAAQDGDNFPSQIRDNKKFDVVNLHTQPYFNLGAPFLTPPTAENQKELEMSLKQLSDVFEEQYRLWTLADRLYVGRAPRLTSHQKNEMEKVRNILDKNMRRASYAINMCYDHGYLKCQFELDEVRKFIGIDTNGAVVDLISKKIDELTVAESFVQYCDIADDDHKEIKVTVDTLKNYATKILGKEVDLINKGDRCQNLADWLNTQESIDLSINKDFLVADLRPITTLVGLKKLNLAGKNLQDISRLSELVNLEELVLDDNLIKTIKPLVGLTKLKFLSINNNKISANDFNYLKVLDIPNGSLDFVSAAGNASELTCPLSFKNQCKLLSFKDAINISTSTESCLNMVGHSAIGISDQSALATGGYSLELDRRLKMDMQLISKDGCQPLNTTLKIPRAEHTMTKLPDGRVLISGGRADSLEILNIDTMESRLVNSKFKSPLSKHTATLLKDGRVLIVGGYTDELLFRSRTTNISANIYIFNYRNDTVVFVGKLNIPRAEHSATLLNDGRVLILGGYAKGQMLSIAEVFNPLTNKVEILDEPMLQGRISHSALLLPNGKVAVVGGYYWDKVVSEGKASSFLEATETIEIFDPEDDSFSLSKEKLKPARGEMQTMNLVDGRIVLVGGETKGTYYGNVVTNLDSAVNDIQLYDPDSESIYDLAKLNNARMLFTLTPLKNRSFLVFGGIGDAQAFKTSEHIIYRIKK